MLLELHCYVYINYVGPPANRVTLEELAVYKLTDEQLIKKSDTPVIAHYFDNVALYIRVPWN